MVYTHSDILYSMIYRFKKDRFGYVCLDIFPNGSEIGSIISESEYIT